MVETGGAPAGEGGIGGDTDSADDGDRGATPGTVGVAVGDGGEPGFGPVLTTAQVAEMLQIHTEYLRKMVREGRIPAHRFPGGREIRFLRDEVLEWLAAQPGEDRSPSRARRRADA